jgi:baculoviral IAP repeat-containing protein 6
LFTKNIFFRQASQLFKSLMGAELAGVDHVEDVLREVETEIETAQQATKHNHKVAKVCGKDSKYFD